MEKFYRVIGAFKRAAGRTADDCLAILGAILVTYGVWQIYAPAGWIVAGAFLMAAAMIMGKGMAGESE